MEKIKIFSKKLQRFIEVDINPDYTKVDPILAKTIGMSNDDYGN